MKKILPFSEQYGAKHEGLEKLRSLLEAPNFVDKVYSGVFSGMADPKPFPSTLLEFYLGNDLRQIYDDIRARPDHYDDRHKEIIEHLVHGAAIPGELTNRDRDDLFFRWMRPTEVEAKSKDLARKITDARHKEDAENAEIILEDGRSLKDHLEGEDSRKAEPSFEKQDFGDKIVF
jgi:hypothetical protein